MTTKIITIANQKGSVGKTTTALSRNRLHSLAQPLLEDLRKEFPYIVAGTLMVVVVVGLISAFGV